MLPEFQPLTAKNRSLLQKVYRGCPYRLSDLSAGMKLMWKSDCRPEIALFSGCLLVKNGVDGKVRFDYPIPAEPNADLSAALSGIESFCMENYLPLCFSAVPEEVLGDLVSRYRKIEFSSDRSQDDYLYEAEDLRNFQGKHYAGQRNHIKKFRSQYPDAVFRRLTKSDEPALRAFFEKFTYHTQKKGAEAPLELRYAKAFLSKWIPGFFVGGMVRNGELLSVSLGEICGDTAIVHVEKALSEYEGIYPATVQAFAETFLQGVRYVNREDDAGDVGLRRSKLQYRPVKLLRKYNVAVKTELSVLAEIPTLQTPRLTLSPLSESDETDYNRLCLDDDRNRYWGYDYRADCPSPDEGYFLATARADFESRTAINWAIRSDGKFLGEILLYDFDYHGFAQVGVRILSERGGNGYGKEALQAVLPFALYSLGLSAVVAKCFEENLPSARMLASVMQQTSTDGTFRYFEYRV